MRHYQGMNFEHFDDSNVIYHRFSHGAVSYTLNGENVNIILEYRIFSLPKMLCFFRTYLRCVILLTAAADTTTSVGPIALVCCSVVNPNTQPIEIHHEKKDKIIVVVS